MLTRRLRYLDLATLSLGVLLAADGCTVEPRADTVTSVGQGLGACGLGDELLTTRTLTPASIPALSALQRAQIIAAVHESAHTDVVTIEEAFDRVDQHEINSRVLRDSRTNQFYVEIEFGAGDNSYGAIFYWGTAIEGGAIHDGDPAKCGPPVFNYDQGDVAPACAGVLSYANTAPFSALDAYLPSNVAHAIVDARTVTPFASVASVVAVNGVAETRLQQLLVHARSDGLVGPACRGIDDQIALSVDEASAIVDFVNQASKNELDGTLGFLINRTVVSTLLASRPFPTVDAVSATTGVGPAVLRALRNAATSVQPFEELVAAVNAIDHPDGQLRVDQHFDWVPLLTPGAGLTDMDCFGIDPALLPASATIRPTLAGGNEVMENAGEAVAIANRFGELAIDSTPGLTDLEWRTAGASFRGCYITYHPSPWVYDRQSFLVNIDTGASLLITSHVVE